MLHLFPLSYQDKPYIGIVFKYDQEILQVIKTLDFTKYSKSNQCFYIDYQTDSYAGLKALGIPYKVYNSRDDISFDTQLTTVDNKNSPDTDTHDTKVISHKTIVITYQNLRLWIKMPYNAADIQVVKSLSGAYWNKSQIQWSVHANLENLDQLQSHFNHWSVEAYNRISTLINSTSYPKIVEIYASPELKGQICVKLKGHGIDWAFLRKSYVARYDLEFKRWILPENQGTVALLTEHYSSQGAKVFNRLYHKDKQYKKQDYSNHEKQQYLLAKFPEKYCILLKTYTDTMIRRNNAWATIRTYVPEIVKYAESVGEQNIANADETTINQYLSQLAGKKIAVSTVHTAINAIKYYYQKVIYRKDLKIDQLVRPKKGFHLPTILSSEETNNLLQSLANIKHICMLYVLYGCGVRLNELLSIQMNDVWWDRNQIMIRNGKGDKDRVVMLSQTLKQLLRMYFDEYMPQMWLIEGQDRLTQYSSRSVQSVVKNALRKAAITKRVTPHTLRHCFATHLMDNGVQLPYIQALLGHKDVKTTMIYTHVTNSSITNIASPLDSLRLSIKKP